MIIDLYSEMHLQKKDKCKILQARYLLTYCKSELKTKTSNIKRYSVCPRSLNLFYIVSYSTKGVKTSWRIHSTPVNWLVIGNWLYNIKLTVLWTFIIKHTIYL